MCAPSHVLLALVILFVFFVFFVPPSLIPTFLPHKPHQKEQYLSPPYTMSTECEPKRRSTGSVSLAHRTRHASKIALGVPFPRFDKQLPAAFACSP